jgi:hypothetical protein
MVQATNNNLPSGSISTQGEIVETFALMKVV